MAKQRVVVSVGFSMRCRCGVPKPGWLMGVGIIILCIFLSQLKSCLVTPMIALLVRLGYCTCLPGVACRVKDGLFR
jgi:hypothetical protein